MENAVDNTVENVEKEARKPRPLQGSDIFVMTSIIGKIGLKNIMKCFDLNDFREAKAEAGDVDMEALGNAVFFTMVDLLLDKLEEAEKPICRLLARLYGMTEDEVRESDANEFIDMFIDVMQDDSFADFFGRAYESVKRMK